MRASAEFHRALPVSALTRTPQRAAENGSTASRTRSTPSTGSTNYNLTDPELEGICWDGPSTPEFPAAAVEEAEAVAVEHLAPLEEELRDDSDVVEDGRGAVDLDGAVASTVDEASESAEGCCGGSVSSISDEGPLERAMSEADGFAGSESSRPRGPRPSMRWSRAESYSEEERRRRCSS